MTVEQLIETLKRYPPKADVLTLYDHGVYQDLEKELIFIDQKNRLFLCAHQIDDTEYLRKKWNGVTL